MNGLELLAGIRDGDLPPAGIAVTLGMTIEELAAGRVVFGLAPDAGHLNPLGTLHGGVLSTLLDSAMGCAVHSTLPEGAGYTTLQLDVKFVRAVRAGDGFLRAEGVALHVGSRTATAEGRVLDPAGRLCAHGTSSLLVMRS